MAKIRMRGRYRWRNGKRIHVKGHLRKDTGRPGRTPKAKRFGARIEPGALRGWSKDLPQAERHRILPRIQHTCPEGAREWTEAEKHLNSCRRCGQPLYPGRTALAQGPERDVMVIRSGRRRRAPEEEVVHLMNAPFSESHRRRRR